jgi:hypothetical protein
MALPDDLGVLLEEEADPRGVLLEEEAEPAGPV